eukprot:CAMPEP_0169462324 /NCGR_PEP_ID=MMETSP1042-20121227/19508_1 /TAXON_ID=464988 /ORGANISM="Hemiselmis andersenii, Strain CCMP1180" /LENGTH=47 /DNA_ID= /DNA_START= /DNA_END= /DNA_ORIENTATION=
MVSTGWPFRLAGGIIAGTSSTRKDRVGGGPSDQLAAPGWGEGGAAAG